MGRGSASRGGGGGVYIQGVCIWGVCIWGEGSVYREGWVDPPMCDLNCSVQGRVPSLRTSFKTPLNLNSEVSNPKILLFSYWFFTEIGWVGLNLKSEVSYAPN